MSAHTIPDGAWPTMITPYAEDGGIDYSALERLIDWYIARGASGLFAVCQSSEMFHLDLRERLDLARACVRLAAGRVPVIASGHVAESLDDQVEEAKRMADTGVEAVVLLPNRFAAEDEGDGVLLSNLDRFLSAMAGGTFFGFYECPYPYKRLVSPRIMRFGVDTGRFGFLKDTSCSVQNMREKLAAVRGTSFKLFNANAATLLDSLREGAAGYSGVMCNFHPDLYAWLCARWKSDPSAAVIQDFLGFASMAECQYYPVNAMYALSLEGLPIRLSSRRRNPAGFTASMRAEIEQMMRVSHIYSGRLPVR